MKILVLIKLINQKSVKSAITTILTMVLNLDLKVCNESDWGIKYFGNFVTIHANEIGSNFFMFDMTKEDMIELIKLIRESDPDDL